MRTCARLRPPVPAALLVALAALAALAAPVMSAALAPLAAVAPHATLVTPPAGLHTSLESSTPADSAVVTEPLEEIRLRFTQAVESEYTSLRLIGPDGSEVTIGALRLVDGTGGREFTAPVPALALAGWYSALWRTAGADGHPIEGTLAFLVAEAAVRPETGAAAPDARATSIDRRDDVTPAASAAEPPPTFTRPSWLELNSPIRLVVRWSYLAALIALIGAVAFRLLVIRRARFGAEQARLSGLASRTAWRIAVVGIATLSLAAVLRLWFQSATLHGLAAAWDPGSLGTYLGSTGWGRAWLLQAALAVLFVIAVASSRADPGAEGGWSLAAVAAIGLATIPALSGHAAAVESLGPLATLLDWVHVLAVSLWLGMLLTMLIVAVRAAQADDLPGRVEGVAALARRFSPLALLGAGVVFASGVGSALMHFNALGELWSTDYGRALLVKLGLLAGLVGFGFYNWRVVLPGLGTGPATARLRRSAAGEICVGAIVVLVTAVLIALPTPTP